MQLSEVLSVVSRVDVANQTREAYLTRLQDVTGYSRGVLETFVNLAVFHGFIEFDVVEEPNRNGDLVQVSKYSSKKIKSSQSLIDNLEQKYDFDD
jgi:hypothetical protein